MHHSAQSEKPDFTIALSVGLLIGYIYGDNHIRIGNRTLLYSTIRRYFRRHFFPVPLFLGTSIFWGT